MTDTPFDQLMAQLDSPMLIVTTIAAGRRAGCLVGFHGQSGMVPDSFAVWLSKANHTHDVARAGEHVAVHMLTADDRDLARLFGTTCGEEVDKFAQCDWTPGPGGVPLLDACPNRIVGTKRAWMDAGTDHTCVVIEPISTSSPSGFVPLRLSDVMDLEPGHAAEEA